MSSGIIDVDPYFDYQAEAQHRDSDRWSPTLRKHHQILWSKQLPNGQFFELRNASQNRLVFTDGVQSMFLSSDRAVNVFRKRDELSSKLNGKEKRLQKYAVIKSDNLGGIVIWPSQRRDGNKMTINGARGFSRPIADRLDLTLECVRLYYEASDSPLAATFNRYDDFFDLFVNFQGYIDFFLLQDWVLTDYSSAKFALPFAGFEPHGFPKNKDEYIQYLQNTLQMVESRNQRIVAWVSAPTRQP